VRRSSSGLLLAAAVLAAGEGCSLLEDTEEAPEGWTVLHYSMADTNLEPFMVEDLNEMGSVGTQGALRLRAFVDRSADYGDDPVLDQGSWVGARVLDIGPESTELVEDLGDVDSADPDTLAAFITDGIAAHPSQHYALIISDHGASWPGIGPDEGSNYDMLELAEIVDAVSTGLEGAGVDQLDLIGFDACLMSSYEVASAMAPLAERMIASQELEPGHGWDYGALQAAADDPKITVDELGAAIVDGFAGQAAEYGTDAEITLALLDLTKMDTVDDALSVFSDALAERVVDVAPAVGRANVETLGFARSANEQEDAHLKDLGLLASAIGVEALDVSDEADDLVRAINDVVVERVSGASTGAATGLSIYFPPRLDLASDAYDDVQTAESWNDFLARYYEAGSEIPKKELPSFTDPQGLADVWFEDGGITVSGAYDELGQDNLTEAVISYALVEDDGSYTYFGEEFAVVDPDGEPTASGFYDLTALTISDGIDKVYAYVSLYYDEEAEVFTLDVPLGYYAADDVDGETYQDVLLSLVLSSEADLISESYYAYDPETETYGELIADPEGIIVPEVLWIDRRGNEEWVPTSDVGLYAELADLQYDVEPLPAGTELLVDLTVYDFGGNSSTVSSYVEVP
jgi:hypothetical protein